ncbi:MAG: WXG100 family type VII secretion target, partial [Synergistaceae bacterium]|nr:WXG100 family type VII secretion target [Synergistaceae bacterium]
RAIAGALKNYASEGLGNLGGISRLVGILSEAEWSEPALKDYVKTFSVSDETRKAYEDFSQDMHKFADFLHQYARSMDEVEGEKPYSAGWYSSLLRYKNNRLLSAIDGLINGLASDWHGEAQEAFMTSYANKKATFQQFSLDMEAFIRFLNEYAQTMEDQEKLQAGKAAGL